MTPMVCATKLAEFLQEKFNGVDYRATDERLTGKQMHVYAGFLPRTISEKDKTQQDPCTVIRPVKINDSKDESTVELQLLVCTYNRDKYYGHMELYHALELIRQWLWQNPIVGGMFRLEGNTETGIPEEQGFPEWIGWMKVKYNIGKPGINVDQIIRLYGAVKEE